MGEKLANSKLNYNWQINFGKSISVAMSNWHVKLATEFVLNHQIHLCMVHGFQALSEAIYF